MSSTGFFFDSYMIKYSLYINLVRVIYEQKSWRFYYEIIGRKNPEGWCN